ncbi:MAG: glycosyl transferase family 28 [Bacteroidetes bacterium]|nr:glycosyl transferase family 28 [Bacteroidota bacterium]
MAESKRILVAPLDWGLGHATRCIPVIREFLEQNVRVIIAADKRPLHLLKEEFPHLDFINLPGYEIAYPTNGSMAVKIFQQIPKVVKRIREEHLALTRIIEEHKLDAIISDNRFGLWSDKVPSVFITHQLNIAVPKGLRIAGMLVNKLNRYYIKRYRECWIPDLPAENGLAGSMANIEKLKLNIPFHHLGTLSRFSMDQDYDKEFDLVCVLSGPEPQRSIFEKILIDQLKGTSYKTIMIRGITESDHREQISENLELIDHLASAEVDSK